MKIALFYHSVTSDWNNGHAHFLRGVASELVALGHDVVIYESLSNWSLTNLILEQGVSVISNFQQAFPHLKVNRYDSINISNCLANVDLVIVHEWNPPDLIREIGNYHVTHKHFCLLFHDTHHRAITDPTALSQIELEKYDGVLAFGKQLRDLYIENGWTRNAWVWHEAADIRIFKPQHKHKQDVDIVWIGNWGDNERSKELCELLIYPIKTLGLRAEFFGVRYPRNIITEITSAGIRYSGWIPNYHVPSVFARAQVTIHIPRRPYADKLQGIPTIRPFEAMACGIPLITTNWNDTEELFENGKDYLIAEDQQQMVDHLSLLLSDPTVSQELSQHSLRTIHKQHTCAHRAIELLEIYAQLT